MTTNVLRSCGSMAALAMALVSAPAFAQTVQAPTPATQEGATPDAGASSEDIVVTATSGERSRFRSSISVSQVSQEAIDRLLQLSLELDIKARCSEVAVRYFSLHEGVRAYGRIYDELGTVNG